VQSILNLVRRLPRNGLYALLHQRSAGEPPPFDPRTRFWLWVSLFVGTPIGLLAAIVETIARSGATVHVVARKRTDAGETVRLPAAQGAPST